MAFITKREKICTHRDRDGNEEDKRVLKLGNGDIEGFKKKGSQCGSGGPGLEQKKKGKEIKEKRSYDQKQNRREQHNVNALRCLFRQLVYIYTYHRSGSSVSPWWHGSLLFPC